MRLHSIKPRNLARTAASGLNSFVGRLCLQFSEASSLIVLVFHAIVRDWEELQGHCLNPRYALTLDQFEQCVRYYLNRGFRAVSPLDVLGGLPVGKQYVMFTFDDGYANNLNVLPVLEAYRVPALFALATEYILKRKPFWWDVVYQQRSAKGAGDSEIDREVDALLQESPGAFSTRLEDQFGEAGFTYASASAINRPMQPEEVRALANHPLVFWANHTARHEYLPRCSADEVRLTIGQAQDALQDLTGSAPLSVVYPYGANDPNVRKICRDLGLRLGFTMVHAKYSTDTDLNSERAMTIPRFAICHDWPIAKQCLETRIDWKPSWLLTRRSAHRVADGY